MNDASPIRPDEADDAFAVAISEYTAAYDRDTLSMRPRCELFIAALCLPITSSLISLVFTHWKTLGHDFGWLALTFLFTFLYHTHKAIIHAPTMIDELFFRTARYFERPIPPLFGPTASASFTRKLIGFIAFAALTLFLANVLEHWTQQLFPRETLRQFRYTGGG